MTKKAHMTVESALYSHIMVKQTLISPPTFYKDVIHNSEGHIYILSLHKFFGHVLTCPRRWTFHERFFTATIVCVVLIKTYYDTQLQLI